MDDDISEGNQAADLGGGVLGDDSNTAVVVDEMQQDNAETNSEEIPQSENSAVEDSTTAVMPAANRNGTVISYQYRSDHLSKVLKKYDLAPVKFQQLSMFDACTGIPSKIAKGCWLTEDEFHELNRFHVIMYQSHERAKLESADAIARSIWSKAGQLTALEVWAASRFIRDLQPLLCCIHDLQMPMPASEMIHDNWLSSLTEERLVANFRGETDCKSKPGYLEKLIRNTSPTFHYLIAQFIEQNIELAKRLAISGLLMSMLTPTEVRMLSQLLCRVTRYSLMADSLPRIPFPKKPDPKHPDHPEIVFDDVRRREVQLTTVAGDAQVDSNDDIQLDEAALITAAEDADNNAEESPDQVETDPEDSPPDECKQAFSRAIKRVGAVVSFAEVELFWDAVKQEMGVTTVEIERLPRNLPTMPDGSIDFRRFIPVECDSLPEPVLRPTRVAKLTDNALFKQIVEDNWVPPPESHGPAKKRKRNTGPPPSSDPTINIGQFYKVFKQNRSLLAEVLGGEPCYLDDVTPDISEPAIKKHVPNNECDTAVPLLIRQESDLPSVFDMSACGSMPDLSDFLDTASPAVDHHSIGRPRDYERRDGAGPSHEPGCGKRLWSL